MAPDGSGGKGGGTGPEASRPAGDADADCSAPKPPASLKLPGGATLRMSDAPAKKYLDDITEQSGGAGVGLGPKDQLASGLLKGILVILGLFLFVTYLNWNTTCYGPDGRFDAALAKGAMESHLEWAKLVVKDMGMSIVTLLVGYLFGSQKS